MAELLDPLTLPLQGSRLIEASAGTGKTWTIAALVLRLVLGHGTPRPLMPGEILVMTFTKAATRELSDRIRLRLVEAAACFRGERAPAHGDAFLTGLLSQYPPPRAGDGASGDDRRAAAWRLAVAAESMDDAAVYTIDAWCQRMLREHAFDSGCLFDEELQADDAAMRAEAARDYWRQQVYPLNGTALDTALAQWPGVDALLQATRGLLELPLPDGAGEGSLADCIERVAGQRATALSTLRHGWTAWAAAMRDWLEALWARRDKPIDGRVLGPSHGRRWLDALSTWAFDPTADVLKLGEGARKLTRAGVLDALKPGLGLEPPEGFSRLEGLMQALVRLPTVEPVLRAHAAARIAERLLQRKTQAGRYGFTDMLERLNHALDVAARGDKARRLQQRIVRQFPVALIDEFQDTSPVQLSIFDRLYRLAADGADSRSADPAADGTAGHAGAGAGVDADAGAGAGADKSAAAQALLLIGDPKQAIYGFRGADIHSYLRARRATAGRHHVLGTNHRSTPALVAAVNGLFGAAEVRAGAGAFLFRPTGDAHGDRFSGAPAAAAVPAASPFPDASEVPFIPVAARGRRERLVADGATVPPLELCLDATPRGKVDNRERYAALCAERVVQLLADPDAGFVADAPPESAASPSPSNAASNAAGPSGPSRSAFARLRPADLAVLVRSGTEAAAVRRALRRRGVASVYLSDQDSVFRSDEARDLLRVLRAVAAPRDTRLARAALATPLLGLSLPELLTLADDDARFDARCDELRLLHAAWQAQGVLAMVRRALHGFGLPARWLADGAAADGRADTRAVDGAPTETTVRAPTGVTTRVPTGVPTGVTNGADAGFGAAPDDDGDRRLTNVLHLAELLQAASARLEGEQALIRWLQQQIADAVSNPGVPADELVLRLESDADLVQVVTVHKSKGLEYPFVLLPFAADFRAEGSGRDAFAFLPDPGVAGSGRTGSGSAGSSSNGSGSNGGSGGSGGTSGTDAGPGDNGRRLFLSPTEAQLAEADHERLREDLRLLYVALTRARHGLWVGAAALKGARDGPTLWHQSAIGRLVSGPAPRSAEELTADVQALGTAVPTLRVSAPVTDPATGLPPSTRLPPPAAPPPLRPTPPYVARHDRLWAIASYSALVKDLAARPGTPPGSADTTDDDTGGLRADTTARADTQGGTDEDPDDGRSDDAPLSDRPARASAHHLRDDEPADDAPAPRRAAAEPWHRFPRGALVGHFLHAQLEWLAGEGFQLDAEPALQEQLRRRCEREGFGGRADDVVAWLRRVCATPLPCFGTAPGDAARALSTPSGVMRPAGASAGSAAPGTASDLTSDTASDTASDLASDLAPGLAPGPTSCSAAALAGLGPTLPEMEFWFPSDGLQARALDDLCRRHVLPGRARPALPERALRGLMMGFVDLVYTHDGRHGVLDHKSNVLGTADADYTPAALAQAMLDHRYDVQAALYLLALHRLLRSRLGQGYAPARHLHGAVYFFLRGIGNPTRGCFYLPPPMALIEALDALLTPHVAGPGPGPARPTPAAGRTVAPVASGVAHR